MINKNCQFIPGIFKGGKIQTQNYTNILLLLLSNQTANIQLSMRVYLYDIHTNLIYTGDMCVIHINLILK